MKANLRALITGVLCAGAITVVHAQNYDLVINNGRVMDPETGFDKVVNVGITDGTIVKITAEKLTGKKTVDATGHVVAPGFIDGHVHYIDSPFGVKLGLRDGLTTPLDLEVGLVDTNKWYAAKKGKSQANYGATASLLGARIAVFDPDYASVDGAVTNDFFSGFDFGTDYIKKLATPEEIEKILNQIEMNLKQGALGVGTTVGYMSEAVTSDELIGLRKLVAQYGRFSHDHVRFMSQSPPTSGMLATQEIVDPALVYGGGTILAHYHSTSGNQMPLIETYIESVRSEGHPVILEIYPYNYGAAGNGVQADYLKPDNYQRNFGREYKDIVDQLTGKPLDKETYERLVKEEPTHPVYLYHAPEEMVIKGVAHPDILIGSDAFPYFNRETGKQATEWDLPFAKAVGHPRGAGTRARVLRWHREGKLGDLTLMQAISKMSYLWADYLGKNGVESMKKKGRLQEGADADIVVFNPKTVTDNSDLPLDKNTLPSTGIPFVVVSGVVVVEDSKVLKDVFPGKPVRATIVE
ncbi:amidohydrolase family protein [Colwellia sp. MEBiC06753]